MKTNEDETEEEIYHDACFAAGMCCLKLASEGGVPVSCLLSS